MIAIHLFYHDLSNFLVYWLLLNSCNLCCRRSCSSSCHFQRSYKEEIDMMK